MNVFPCFLCFTSCVRHRRIPPELGCILPAHCIKLSECSLHRFSNVSTWPLSTETMSSSSSPRHSVCFFCKLNFLQDTKSSVRALQVWWVMAWPKLPSTSSLRVLRQRTAGCHRELLLWRYYREYCCDMLCTHLDHDVKENRPLQISECCLSAACRPDSRIVLDLDPFRLVWKWREYLRDWFELSMHVFYFYLLYLIFQCWTVTRITHDFWTHLSLWETNVHFSQFFSLFFTVLLRQNDQLVYWKTMERFIYE